MKIGFLCSSFAWGGLEINNLKLCIWLKERGHDPILFCHQESKLYYEAKSAKLTIVNFSHRKKHIVFYSAFLLTRLFLQYQLSVIVIGHYRHHYLGVWAKIFSRRLIKLVYWQQMQVALNKKDIYHAFFFNQLDVWITPLEYLRNQILSNTVLNKEKIVKIPLCIDIRLLDDRKVTKDQARELLSIPTHDFIVGVIGRIDRRKGQESVIRAIRELKNRHLPVKAVIIGAETHGEHGYLAFLKKLAVGLDIGDEVFFRPFSVDVIPCFMALDIFLMSSISEPVGMVTIEAMALGIPVIGTNSGGTPELLNHGKAGILYESGKELDLADKIEYLYLNENVRDKFRSLGKEQSKAFSHEVQCALFENAMLPQSAN
jgi:D-inositol-3-phosphate glycosyltransferase